MGAVHGPSKIEFDPSDCGVGIFVVVLGDLATHPAQKLFFPYFSSTPF